MITKNLQGYRVTCDGVVGCTASGKVRKTRKAAISAVMYADWLFSDGAAWCPYCLDAQKLSTMAQHDFGGSMPAKGGA